MAGRAVFDTFTAPRMVGLGGGIAHTLGTPGAGLTSLLGFDGTHVAFQSFSCAGARQVTVVDVDAPRPPGEVSGCPVRIAAYGLRLPGSGKATIRVRCPNGCRARLRLIEQSTERRPCDALDDTGRNRCRTIATARLDLPAAPGPPPRPLHPDREPAGACAAARSRSSPRSRGNYGADVPRRDPPRGARADQRPGQMLSGSAGSTQTSTCGRPCSAWRGAGRRRARTTTRRPSISNTRSIDGTRPSLRPVSHARDHDRGRLAAHAAAMRSSSSMRRLSSAACGVEHRVRRDGAPHGALALAAARELASTYGSSSGPQLAHQRVADAAQRGVDAALAALDLAADARLALPGRLVLLVGRVPVDPDLRRVAGVDEARHAESASARTAAGRGPCTSGCRCRRARRCRARSATERSSWSSYGSRPGTSTRQSDAQVHARLDLRRRPRLP